MSPLHEVDAHFFLCQAGRRRRGIARELTGDNGVRDHRLVRVNGNVLHNDLLLPSTSMLI